MKSIRLSNSLLISFYFFLIVTEAEKLLQNLIIIYGQYRSFDITCPYIFKHLVKPNLPAKVLIIISKRKVGTVSFKPAALDCLKMFKYRDEIIVTVLDGYLPDFNQSKPEFQVTEAAVNWAEKSNNSFEYILKVRTDNMVRADIDLKTIFGDSDNKQFTKKFSSFESTFRLLWGEKYQRFPTWQDVVWGWVFTAGNDFFISPMVFGDPRSVWCPVSPKEWNKNLKEYIYKLTAPSEECSSRCYYSYTKMSINNALSIHKVLYLIGSTWIHFGPASLFMQAAHDVVSKFGTLDWSELGYSIKRWDWETVISDKEYLKDHPDPKWLWVTESQFRAVHMHNGWNLIDLVKIDDYIKSFNGSHLLSFEEEFQNPNLKFYLFRDCSQARLRVGCGCYNPSTKSYQLITKAHRLFVSTQQVQRRLL